MPQPVPLKRCTQGVGLPVFGASAFLTVNVLMFVSTAAAMGISGTPVGITKVPSYPAPMLGCATTAGGFEPACQLDPPRSLIPSSSSRNTGLSGRVEPPSIQIVCPVR